MTGNRAKRGEEETERERERIGERETTVVKGENGVSNQRRWHWLILTIVLNQHLGIFGDINEWNNKYQ
jgi:hypothetical protein